MSTKPQKKRETTQIRILKYFHKKLKMEAIDEETTISKLTDQIFLKHFEATQVDMGEQK